MAISKSVDQMIGQYELVQFIGQDSFAEKYLAYDTESARHVLLSVLGEYYSENISLRAQYIKRARILSRIRHPNIAAIYDLGEMPTNKPFVVSEHFEGFPMLDRLNKLAEQESPAHVTYALTLIRQIASGLALAERLGCFHYQLTPKHIYLRNVTLKAEDTAILVNIDIPPEFAHKAGSETDINQEPYLSPEQTQNKEIDGRSHVYSLGIILFQLLTSKIPSQEKTNWRRPLHFISNGTSILQDDRDDLSPETYELVARSINPKPASRYGSLRQFVDALDQALEAEDLRIHTGNIREPRRPRPIYVAPFLLLFLCFALASAVWIINPSNSVATMPDAANNENPLIVNVTTSLSSPTPTIPITRSNHNIVKSSSNTSSNTPILSPTIKASATNRLENKAAVMRVTFTPTIEFQPTNIPTNTSTATAEPTETRILATPRPEYRITVNSASLRRGPGVLFDVDSYLYEDEFVTVLGKNDSINTWYVVETADGRTGWISESVGTSTGTTAIDVVPLAATIPSPPPTLTPTPTNTPVPTDTPVPPIQSGGNSGNSEEDNPRPKATPTPPL